MTRICVITSDVRGYYALVSRLRRAGFAFMSMLPDDADSSNDDECELVLTTKRESGLFHGNVIVVEELDEDPDVVRGQILRRLAGSRGTMLVGIDPGLRMGLAAFYGDAWIAFRTFNSRDRLCANVAKLITRIGPARSLVRIGNGDPVIADSIAANLIARLPGTVFELVDEAGTSSRTSRTKGAQGDQSAAAKIAFRKGLVFHSGGR
jgi:hypothetical protein